jgi:hypothetical protein
MQVISTIPKLLTNLGYGTLLPGWQPSGWPILAPAGG